MRKSIHYFLVIVLITLVYSCNTKNNNETSLNVETEETQENESVALPMTAMILSHSVVDFDSWKIAYDAHDSVRKSNGLTIESVHRSFSDPNTVVVTAYTTDHESAKSFVSNPNLKDVMQKAGVNSMPKVSYWDIKWTRPGGDYPPFEGHYIIDHKVKDYDVWVEKFHKHDSTRKANGLLALLVGTNADSTNHVGMYIGVTNIIKANALLSDSVMVKLQIDAGVLGKPTATLIRVSN
jgi:hypothetical protein